MSSTQRVALLAIAAVVAVAAFIALRPGDEDKPKSEQATRTQSQSATNSTSTGTASTPATTTTDAKRAPPPLLTATKITELRVNKGETVTFRARSAQDDEIHVHGYDLSRDAPAGQTVRMSFRATIEGIFEIEFENAGKQIAKLTVEP